MVTIFIHLPHSSVNFYTYEHDKKWSQSLLSLTNDADYVGICVNIYLVSGGIAMITAASTTYPSSYVRNDLAAQRNAVYHQGLWHSHCTICKGGFTRLYEGLGATLLGVRQGIAIRFPVHKSSQFYRNQLSHAISKVCWSLSQASLDESCISIGFGPHEVKIAVKGCMAAKPMFIGLAFPV